MSTLAVLNTNENLRCNHITQPKKNIPIKVHSPKIRLRLQEACDNSEKAKVSTVQYSLNPEKSVKSASFQVKKHDNHNYLSDSTINRNKISQMDKIIFPSSKDHYVSDKPPMRCLGEESLSYLTRNRGTLVLVGSGKGTVVPDNIHIRCPSREAEDNLRKGRGLGMMNVLQHSTDFRDNPPVARIRDEEAAEISRKHQGSSMSALMHPPRQCHSASVREPRCPTAEARETWQKSRGDSMLAVLGGKVANDSMGFVVSPKKRVKDEFGNEIEPQRSNGVSQVMHAKQEDYSFSKYEPRVRLDGREIEMKNRGTLINNIYSTDNKRPISAQQPSPRVLRQGREIADASKGFLTKQLFMKYGQCPMDPKPKARVTRYSQKIAIQSRGGAMKDALCPPRQKHSKRRIHSAHR